MPDPMEVTLLVMLAMVDRDDASDATLTLSLSSLVKDLKDLLSFFLDFRRRRRRDLPLSSLSLEVEPRRVLDDEFIRLCRCRREREEADEDSGCEGTRPSTGLVCLRGELSTSSGSRPAVGVEFIRRCRSRREEVDEDSGCE